MKDIFKIGDSKTLHFLVKVADCASFESGNVHPVYATFALGRDIEWTCRQFVLEMKEESEEGIGTFLNIKHESPALINSKVEIIATLESVLGNSINCSFVAQIGDRIIATGTQGQKIILKTKLSSLFESLNILTQ